jgi:hypothetical protein
VNNLPPELTVSLREYVDVRFEALDKAVTKAEVATEKRFESVNEFRSALNDSNRLLMPRSEAEQALKTLSDKLDALTLRVNAKDDQNTGKGQSWALILSSVSLISTLLGIAFLIARH